MLFTDRVRRAVTTRRRWCWSTGIISFIGVLIFTGGSLDITFGITGLVLAIVWSITTDTIQREEAAREL